MTPSAPDEHDDTALFDRRAMLRHFARAANSYAQHDPLQREVARRMDERLAYVRLTPQRILDLGCGPARDHPLLTQRYPQAQWLGLDYSLPMLNAAPRATGGWKRLLRRTAPLPLLCADMQALPLTADSIQLAWSNLALHWLDAPDRLFAEVFRVLQVEGLFMFSTFGPDTLKELRAVLPPHSVHPFIDMHDLGDALVRAGFSGPVMDMEMLTLTYDSADALFADLRHSGGSNALTRRSRGLAGAGVWREARRTLAAAHDTGGELRISFEVIQGHAWKLTAKHKADGPQTIRFQPRRTAHIMKK